MEKKVEKIHSDEWLKDLPIQAENPAFKPEEMIIYAKCEAKDNLKKLIQKLREVAPRAKFVDDYLQVRENLANVWEVEQKSDSMGVKREGIGKFNLGNITTVNNLSQFTKY